MLYLAERCGKSTGNTTLTLDMNALGIKVRELRTLRDWTQNELARRSSVSRGALASLETGKSQYPTTANLLKLAKAFNISPDELYDETLNKAAGYIKEARTSHQYDETLEQLLDNIKLDLRKLEKKLQTMGIIPLRG